MLIISTIILFTIIKLRYFLRTLNTLSGETTIFTYFKNLTVFSNDLYKQIMKTSLEWSLILVMKRVPVCERHGYIDPDPPAEIVQLLAEIDKLSRS